MTSLRTSVLRWVAAAFPQLVYGYPRTYVVAAVRADDTLDLVPPVDAPHLPELEAVEQWCVLTTLPEEGAEVLVAFRDSNPARPVVIGAKASLGDETMSPPGALGSPPPFTPLAPAAGRVVRYGDSIIMPVGTAGNGAAAFVVPAAPGLVSRVKA